MSSVLPRDHDILDTRTVLPSLFINNSIAIITEIRFITRFFFYMIAFQLMAILAKSWCLTIFFIFNAEIVSSYSYSLSPLKISMSTKF